MTNQFNVFQGLFFTLIFRFFLLFIIIFTFILFVGLRVNHFHYLDNYLRDVKLSAPSLFYETYGYENAFFIKVIPKSQKPDNVYNILLKSVTQIKMDDTRSYLGNELPGLSLYNAKIYVAGKGVNYTNLPSESPAPSKEAIDKTSNGNENKPGGETKSSIPEKKVVFIYHTHSWESYLPALKNASVPNQAVSADPNLDVIHVGDIVGQELEKDGIGYIHDTTNKNYLLLERGWTYVDAYKLSRETVMNAMKTNRDLNYFIDIHRDSSRRNLTTTTIKGQSYARLSFIVGDANPNYKENLYMGTKLNDYIERHYPGLSKGVIGKNKSEGNGIYNQDLSKNAILVEVGGVDNTLDELNRTAKVLGDAIYDFYKSQNK